jgi:hypothetical protein
MGGNIDQYIPMSDYGSPQRESEIRTFAMVAPMMMNAEAVLTKKAQSLQWVIEGGRNQAKKWQERLNQLENGDGWDLFIGRWVRAYCESDRGAYVELIRAAPTWAVDPDGHLTERGEGSVRRGRDQSWEIVDARVFDPVNCFPTTSKEFPLEYHNPYTGKIHNLRSYQYMHLLDMPAVDDRFPGYGVCLHRDATVRMANGKTKRIIDVVRERDPGPVQTVDHHGRIVERAITNWYKNKRDKRKMINLRGLESQHWNGVKKKNSWLTEDHPVLTPNGWRRAGELRTGDEIVTEFPEPNYLQTSLLIGTILGDSCALRRCNNTTIGMGHKAYGEKSQEEWYRLKADALSEFGWRENYEEYQWKEGVIIPKKKVEGRLIHGWTRQLPSLNWFNTSFYDNGKQKHIPLHLITEYFTPYLLAAWYLDDGHIMRQKGKRPGAQITTVGFPEDEVRQICEMLTSLGYEARPNSAGKNRGGLNVTFTKDGSEALFKMIAPYVPECMRYKLPKGSEDFSPNLWNLPPADRFVDKVIVSANYKEVKGYNEPKNVYCILLY